MGANAIEIIMGRRRGAMGTIVMIEGVTLDRIMSPGIVTLVHQTGDLRSPPRDESAVRPRLETAAVRRQRKQRLASLPLTDPRRRGPAQEVHLADGPRHRMLHETRLHVSA